MNKSAEPLVSVIMANLNGAAHIEAAVRSVLRQTETSLELIISDDGSRDASLERARAAAAGDPRLVLLAHEGAPTGPAAARNRALRVAHGRWIAIVDNDDYIHPERLQHLIGQAERDGADIAADDMLVFYQNGQHAPHAHLRGRLARAPHWISAADYERSNRLLSGRRALGYLKPVLRRKLSPHYDESLRVAEDSDLVLRLLIGGARMRVYPDIGYYYRKHDRSISHRLDVAVIDAMDAAYARLDSHDDAALARELAAGRRARADARAFSELIDALKARRLSDAIRISARRPSALRLFKDPFAARLRARRVRAAATSKLRVALLSRQRIVGATNGSSSYVLALTSALRDAGFDIDYIGASPKIFGRWAMLRLRSEIGLFDRYGVRGGVRMGPIVFALAPARWAASSLAVVERLIVKLGLPRFGWSQKADYAQGAALTRADALYVARRTRPGTCAVLCDYAFLNPLAPYAAVPQAPVVTIMHDLMSARITDADDGVLLSAAEELRLLNMTDVILAIQADEAAKVRAAVAPHVEVILAPHAVTAAMAPQRGNDDALLFVGSNTQPNVVALGWFFRNVWPAVRAARPAAQLIVAGSVARSLDGAPDGVTLLGVVDDLAPLYRDAGVVISPLRSGSGLKIKLIEAWAAGKAVVGTSVTAQGVAAIAAGAMVMCDDAGPFAEAIVSLAADGSKREALARAGLRNAQEYFSAAAATAEFVGRIRRAASSAGESPPALSDESGHRHERADQKESQRSVEAKLVDQQPS
jgi:glycosyltransferase involved in cell wall biosynthesis